MFVEKKHRFVHSASGITYHLLFVLFLFSAVRSVADYQYAISYNEVIITGYIGSGGDITIPDMIDGEPVVHIAREAFAECQSITAVTIPDSVVNIGYRAFAECINLNKVNIGAGVNEIRDDFFDLCEKLTEINVSANNHGFSSKDGVLFDKNQSVLRLYPRGRIGAYQIPDGVSTIEKRAFDGCKQLSSVVFPESVTSIGEGAFSWCVRLAKVIIPAAVTNINERAFYGCEELSSIYFTGTPPSAHGNELFSEVPGTAYYIFGTNGWGNEYAGLPTAVWTSQAIFNGNDGTPSYGTRTYNVDNLYGKLPNATHPNLVFDGWYTQAKGGNKITVGSIVPLLTEEHTLYARWGEKIQFYTVTFELGDLGIHRGGGDLLQEVEPDGSAVVPDVTAAEGWNFESWDKGFQTITTNTTVKAIYSFTYYLSAGWNLISVNLNLDADSQARLLNRGAKALDQANNTYVLPAKLQPPQAYWLYSQEEDEITVTGSALKDFDFEASLKAGWNFVGPLPYLSLADSGASIWGWNGANFCPTENLLPGQGYWLHWAGTSLPPATDTYLVIDLRDGPEAEAYPVRYRSSPPTYGWTEEYKTTKLVLRRIPAGTFLMGSPENELGRTQGYEANETQHQVTLSKDFYVGVFEVTQRQWERVMGKLEGYFLFPITRPVEGVSYNDIRGSDKGSSWPTNYNVDADSFLGRLRARTGLTFDLPTEAQWEYACRAGTSSALNSGKNLTDVWQCPNMGAVGRYWNNGGSDDNWDESTAARTAKVGSYLPNQWGLYDMHGNVAELCLDWYPGDLGSSARTDPRGDGVGSYRVSRGGNWDNFSRGCRSASRDGDLPYSRYSVLGFRLSLTLQ